MLASWGHCCSRFVGSTLPSPLLVFSAVLLSSCSLAVDRWPTFRCPVSLSASTTVQSAIGFTSWLTISTLVQFCLPSSCVLANLASCSPLTVGSLLFLLRQLHAPVSSARLLRCLIVFMLAYCRSLAKFPMPLSAFQPPLLLSLLSVSHPG